MNKKQIKCILEEKYNNKDLTILFEGAIQTYITINKARIFVGCSTLLIANDEIEIKIDLDEVTFMNFDNILLIQVESQKIIIDF